MVNNDSVGLVFRALENPARRTLLERIGQKRMPVADLGKPLGISMPAVSRHLKILEEAQLIRRHKVARCYYFEINLAALEEAEQWLQTHRAFWTRQLSSLRKYLDSHPNS
jgi:DNA-binding transcriptional ArsR family regulator